MEHLYKQQPKNIFTSAETLHQFLNENISLYKYHMRDILFFSFQSHSLKLVANVNQWRALGRRILDDELPLMVVDTSSDNQCKEYYDVKQTFGHEIKLPYLSTPLSNEELSLEFEEAIQLLGIENTTTISQIAAAIYQSKCYKSKDEPFFTEKQIAHFYQQYKGNEIQFLLEVEKGNQVAQYMVNTHLSYYKDDVTQVLVIPETDKPKDFDDVCLDIVKQGLDEQKKQRVIAIMKGTDDLKVKAAGIEKIYQGYTLFEDELSCIATVSGLDIQYRDTYSTLNWQMVGTMVKNLHEKGQYLSEIILKQVEIENVSSELLEEKDVEQTDISDDTVHKEDLVAIEKVSGEVEEIQEKSSNEEQEDLNESSIETQQVTKSEVIVKQDEAVEGQLDLFSVLEDETFEEDQSPKGASQGFYFPIDSSTFYPDKPLEKITANIEALELLKILKSENRQPTLEEKEQLAKYVGWGGLTQLFDLRQHQDNITYQELRKRLKVAVSESQYKSMEESSLTAYYTDPVIIQEIYTTIEKLGFKNGKILDPASGTGNFFSAMPKLMRESSDLYSVELDDVTGQIMTYLHEDTEVLIKGFEETSYEPESFDLVVGNIPFNDFTVGTGSEAKLIHDYFINKSLDLTHEGGLVVVISSTGTLDKKSTQFREEIHQKAEFLGAVRLPNDAFKKIAGTEVTTDIIFLQKNTQKKEKDRTWLEVKTDGIRESFYNHYFIENPDQVVGLLFEKNFRGKTLSVQNTLGSNFLPRLRDALSHINGSYTPVLKEKKESLRDKKEVFHGTSETELISTGEPSEPFRYFVGTDGLIYFKTPEENEPVTLSQNKLHQMKRLIAISGTVDKLISIQQDSDYSTSEFDTCLSVLNRQYDEYVKQYSCFNDVSTNRLFHADMSCTLLQSIEIKEKDGSYSKGDIFFKPTIRPKRKIVTSENAFDALNICLNDYNKVDISFIAENCRKSEQEVIEELSEHIFRNIEGNWLTRDEYLSGDVKTKLSEAEKWAASDKRYERNVQALKKVIPAPLNETEIECKIGSTWIPEDVIYQFMIDVLGANEDWIEKGFIEIERNPLNGAVFIKGASNIYSQKGRSLYGTSRRSMSAILEDSLNLRISRVNDSYEEDGKKKYKLNPSETVLAQEKQAKLELDFKLWLFQDDIRKNRLLEIYNETFNRYVTRQYDGSYLKFDGLNPKYQLRPHQVNAVCRTIMERRALYGHVVGAGKTLTMIAAGMKLKDLGIIHKPLYVVPNHLTKEFGIELLQFYPGKKVLITTNKDFQKENRKRFISKIATGNYDAIIIGMTQFERIPISKERQIEMLEKEIDEVSQAMMEQSEDDQKSWSFKQMKLFEKKQRKKLETLLNSKEKESPINFEDLGVDFLFVDEAHNYKNLYTHTKLSNVAGVNASHSQRASDMLLKIRYLQENHDNRHVAFATGTPISNSMSELYTMQRYLQPDILEQMDLSHFDSWASTFGEIESALEIKPEGSGYQVKTRFSKFHNLPELMTTFSLIADIQTQDMLNLPVPDIKGGKAELVVTDITEAQERLMEELIERAECIRDGLVEPNIDNMLKLTHEAKLMSIDMRLLDNLYDPEDSTKITRCCDKAYAIYKKSEETLGTQIIFSDSGTPKPHVFNVYDEVKDQLMRKGIPSEEIAFIHDAKNEKQREQLFEKVRNGQVRIILGSTGKVGTGTNIQNKLVAAHHLDCPWRPSDLIQRDGRIVRQGNENKEVEIFRYITKGTFDSYLWQIQEQKLRYISQVMTNQNISRSCDDIDETVLDASEAKAAATSNPFIAEKANVDNQVAKLSMLKRGFIKEQHALKENVETILPNKISNTIHVLSLMEKDKEVSEKHQGEEFHIEVLGRGYTERKEAGEALLNHIFGSKMIFGDSKNVGTYKEFSIVIEKSNMGTYNVVLEGNHHYKADFNSGSEVGSITRIENLEKGIPGKLDQGRETLEILEKELEESRPLMNRPFEREEELSDLLQRQQELVIEISQVVAKNNKHSPVQTNDFQMER